MATKHIEPILGADSFSCPHCNALAHQSWYKVFMSSFRQSDRPRLFHFDGIDHNAVADIKNDDERKRVSEFVGRLEDNLLTYRLHEYAVSSHAEMVNLFLAQCFSCKGFSVWLDDRIIYPAHSAELSPHDEMPAPVREDFDEAAKILDLSPRGAAALLRLAIQRLMPNLGEKGVNLNDDIAALVKKGLEPEIQQAMDVLRVVGNNAVHPGLIDLKDDRVTAIALCELLNLIVERRIAIPNRIKEMYDMLPPDAINAIAKRDNKN